MFLSLACWFGSRHSSAALALHSRNDAPGLKPSTLATPPCVAASLLPSPGSTRKRGGKAVVEERQLKLDQGSGGSGWSGKGGGNAVGRRRKGGEKAVGRRRRKGGGEAVEMRWK